MIDRLVDLIGNRIRHFILTPFGSWVVIILSVTVLFYVFAILTAEFINIVRYLVHEYRISKVR